MPLNRAALILLLGLLGCAAAPPEAQDRSQHPQRLLVVDHGLHAGLILRRADLLQQLPALAESLPAGDWVELGWGDEAFYRAPRPTLAQALRALLGPTPAVLHVQPHANDPRRRFAAGDILHIHLDEQAYRRLLQILAASFTRSPAGQPIELGPGLFLNSRFYRAEGRYSLLRTCNTWLFEALRAAGCPLPQRPVVTTDQLIGRLRTMTRADGVCQAGVP